MNEPNQQQQPTTTTAAASPARYGVPYQGSKNLIAPWVCSHLPAYGFEAFVDLFAGGCAITHCMMTRPTGYGRYLLNDYDGLGVDLFRAAINGDYRHERRWISRDDFKRLRLIDPYVTICWSFGNNMRNYLYSAEVEPWKRALHYARVLGDPSLLRAMGIEGSGSRADVLAHQEEYKARYVDWYKRERFTTEAARSVRANTEAVRLMKGELRQMLRDALRQSGLTAAEVDRRLGTQMAGHYFGASQWAMPTREHFRRMQAFMPALREFPEDKVNALYDSLRSLQRLESLQSLQSLERLQRLESLQSLGSLQRLQRLQNLERLQSLESARVDYRLVEIPRGCLVYCDPPYRGTAGYGDGGFDHEAFYRWALEQRELVVISEYEMPVPSFVCVAETAKRRTFSGGDTGAACERLYVPAHQVEAYRQAMRRGRWTEARLFD